MRGQPRFGKEVHPRSPAIRSVQFPSPLPLPPPWGAGTTGNAALTAPGSPSPSVPGIKKTVDLTCVCACVCLCSPNARDAFSHFARRGGGCGGAFFFFLFFFLFSFSFSFFPDFIYGATAI